MEKLLYGVAYYDEYMPYERLDQDVQMMKKAGINLVRIAESTWSTLEPVDGKFDFTHIDRVLEAMGNAGIHVIIGTPTYAVPAWMVKAYPDIMVTTKQGRSIYGARQIMDITNKSYLFYCERVIRTLMEHVAQHPAVIGFQVDNETKHFGTSGENVQKMFVAYLRKKFNDDVELMNEAYGLNYWSNAIHTWEDFPDVRGTINGSLGGEFEKFQRGLVTEFLSWQAGIVREYKRDDQFITHNFDYGWKDGSYGVQPDVDHYQAAKALDIAGCDIYHPSQSKLTGTEVAFCGDLCRSLKKTNYFVLETQAQGFAHWVPYDGQLRQLAFSHLASGADLVEYWHWHSIHNSMETYWKGLLSHDFKENKPYMEACTVGADFARLNDKLIHLKKKNQIAFLVSNESLTGMKWFPAGDGSDYNDCVRWLYDALYEKNYECDFIFPETENYEAYKVIILPAFYVAPEPVLHRLLQFVKAGGVLIGTYKSCFTNEHVKVYADTQPHILRDCFGVEYDQFVIADQVLLQNSKGLLKEEHVEGFMECLRLTDGEEVLRYVHENWGQYTAAARKKYGKGQAYYFGCRFGKALLKTILDQIMKDAGIAPSYEAEFPLIARKGINPSGKEILYLFHYSGKEREIEWTGGNCMELLNRKEVKKGERLHFAPWDVKIMEKSPAD